MTIVFKIITSLSNGIKTTRSCSNTLSIPSFLCLDKLIKNFYLRIFHTLLMNFYKKISIVLACCLLLSGLILAQDKKAGPFDNGEPIGLVFANFHTGISEGNNPTAIEVRRVYLGYKFKMSKYYSAKIQLDIGSPDDVSEYSLLRRFAYFKNAYLQYQRGKIRVRFGIIPLKQFKLQEKIWGHRYIYKTVVDEHGLGSSADLGASLTYQATSFLELDLTFMNGEGYSKPQTDYSYKTGLGFTLKPWKGLIFRLYSDMIRKNDVQVLFVGFVGYEIKDKLYFGIEYDTKLNNRFEDNHDINVFSTFLSYNFNEQFQVFGRYDIVGSNIIDNDETPWNLSNDGSTIITGIQYKPISKIKLSLNYQDWVPYAENLDGESYIYFNVEYKVW